MSDEPLYCGSCHTQVNPRDLHTQHFIVSRCRKCGGLLQETERFGYTDKDAITAEDVAGIDAWLATVASHDGLSVTSRPSGKERREYTWDVTGLSVAWACSVSYDPDRPGVVQLLATFTSAPGTIPDDISVLLSAFGTHCLQPHARRIHQAGPADLAALGKFLECAVSGESAAGEMPAEPPTTREEWGGQLFLSTSQLPVELFSKAISRLDAAMRDAATRIGRPVE
jgi:hypothetical protein